MLTNVAILNCICVILKDFDLFFHLKHYQLKTNHKIKTPVTAVDKPTNLIDSIGITIIFSIALFNELGNKEKNIPSIANTNPKAARRIVTVSFTFPQPLRKILFFGK